MKPCIGQLLVNTRTGKFGIFSGFCEKETMTATIILENKVEELSGYADLENNGWSTLETAFEVPFFGKYVEENLLHTYFMGSLTSQQVKEIQTNWKKYTEDK